jgi:hypothetical protein
MAGDWIKMRHSLASDPDVIAVAINLEIDEDTLVGKLHRLWSWFDIHTTNGHAKSVTAIWLDCHCRCSGLCQELVRVGWLDIHDGGVSVPNFDRHNGDPAKKRALDSERKRKSRKDKERLASGEQKQIEGEKHPESVLKLSRSQADKSGTRGEERRGEYIDPPKGGSGTAENVRDELVSAWNSLEGLPRVLDFTPKRMAALRARLREPPWPDSWRQAIARIPKCKFLLGVGGDGWKADIDFFLRPDSVTKILEGSYDHAKRPASGNRNEPGPGQKYDPSATPSGVF